MELEYNSEIKKWRSQQLTDLELMKDIREKGLLQPLIARKLPNDKIELIAGHRRFMALKSLGKKPDEMDIKILENVSDEQAILIAIAENRMRKDMNAIEEARAFRSLLKLKLTHKQIGEKAKFSETYVRDRLHLLELSKEVQELILTDKVPVSYAPTLRKLNHYEAAQLQIAKKIASNQYDRITTIEKAEEHVTEVLKEIQRRKDLLAKYGPCPKCGSTDIDTERWSYDKGKIMCLKCKHVWHGETKEPWSVYELKQDAEKLGLKMEVSAPGKAKLTPKEITNIVEERTAAIAAIEEPNPSFRSGHDPVEMIMPLVKDDNIQNLTVDGHEVTIKLIHAPQLHFKATRKNYQTGEKAYVTVSKGW